jgi:nucleoside-diphosphate-sugar epimerase
MHVAVTGAQGFVGAALCAALQRQGHDVVAIGRPGSEGGLSLSAATGWIERFRGVDAVVHLAARAHITHESAADPLRVFREVNVEGTRRVASAARDAGVRRFVFVSSIGVFGSSRDDVISEQSSIGPQEPYAISKWQAEQALHALTSGGAMELTIVRPTLVYGPNAKGNFQRLMRLVAARIPLPFGSIRNRRSFIGLDNLCDLLLLCTTHPQAAGRTFVAADGEDVSTSELLSLISAAMQRRDLQFKFPLTGLRALMSAFGRGAEFDKLTSNLAVDAGYARSVLSWAPAHDLRSGIQRMVDSFAGKSP